MPLQSSTQEVSLAHWLARRPRPEGLVILAPPSPGQWSNPWDGKTRELGRVEAVPSPLPEHAGLWLDRFLAEPQDDGIPEDSEGNKPGRDALYRGATQTLGLGGAARTAYTPLYERWKTRAQAKDSGTVRLVQEVITTSRLVLHAATGSSVTEGSILLHHTYGVPYLPGSALKGISRARGRRLGRLLPERYDALFQTPGFTPSAPTGRDQEPAWLTELLGYVEMGEEGGLAGMIDFWDALWIPPDSERGPSALPAGLSTRRDALSIPTGSESPLALDIVNPHHTSYCTDDTHPLPRPNEEPIPTHFLSIAPGTSFLLVLETAVPNAQEWLTFLLQELLLPALELDGIGSKTAAGYGRLFPKQPLPQRYGPYALANNTPTAAVAAISSEHEGLEAGMVIRNKSDGSLRVTFPSGPYAEARGTDARNIHARLSPDVKLKLDKNKAVRLLALWKKSGNARLLIDLKEP